MDANKKLIASMQDDVARFIVTHLPKSQRGAYITTLRDATTKTRYAKALDKLVAGAREYEKIKQLNKVIKTKQNKLSYINKVGKFSPRVMSEIKKAIGLVDKKGRVRHIKFATEEQLNTAIEMIRDRLDFVKREGLLKTTVKKVPELNYVDYSRAHVVSKKIDVIKGFKDAIRGFKTGADRIIRPVASRAGEIIPSLKNAMKKVDAEEAINVARGNNRIEPFIKKFNKQTLPIKGAFKAAVMNGDFNMADRIASSKGLDGEWKDVKKWLDEMFEKAKDSGIDIGKRENYFPRMVTDSLGLQEELSSSGMIDRWIKEEAGKLGRQLSDEERAKIVSTRMRGFGTNNNMVYLPKSRIEKERVVDIIEPRMMKYYGDPIESLVSYNELLNRTIAVNKFFGKGNVKNLDDGSIDWIGTIGNLAAKSNLSPEKQKELQSLLVARYGSGHPTKQISALKNMVYITQMNSFLSAVTQLGDMLPSMYANGIMDTIKAVFTKRGVTMKDLGLDRISAEINKGGVTNWIADKVFTLNGIKLVDKFGKETFINASLNKYKRDAKIFLKTGKENTSIKEIRNVLGEDADKTIKMFAKGNTEEIKNSDDSLYVLFNKLSRLQPISMSEMPEAYLKHPNARFLYALKTWTIKTLDFIREESFDKMIKGDPKEKAQGLANLVMLVTLYTAAGAGTDYIKNALQGKEQESLTDSAANNMLKILSLNKYMLDSFVEKGPAGAFASAYIPGATSMDDVVKDFSDNRKKAESGQGMDWSEYRSIKYIPFIGRKLYYSKGRGSDDFKSKSKTKLKIKKAVSKKIKIKSSSK